MTMTIAAGKKFLVIPSDTYDMMTKPCKEQPT